MPTAGFSRQCVVSGSGLDNWSQDLKGFISNGSNSPTQIRHREGE